MMATSQQVSLLPITVLNSLKAIISAKAFGGPPGQFIAV